MKRPIRGLETVHFEESTKRTLIADIELYLDPTTSSRIPVLRSTRNGEDIALLSISNVLPSGALLIAYS